MELIKLFITASPVWLMFYLLGHWRAKRLMRFLPADTPEKVDAIWKASVPTAGKSFLWGVLLAASGLLYIFLINVDDFFDPQNAVLQNFSLFILFSGVLTANMLAFFPFNKAFKKLNTNAWRFLRISWGKILLNTAPLLSMICVVELYRLLTLADWLPPEGILLPLLAGLVIDLLLLFLLSAMGLKLLGVTRANVDPKLKALVERQAARLGCRPPRLLALPHRGDNLALAFVFSQYLTVSDYLLLEMPPEEIESAVAHEMAHFSMRHFDLRIALHGASFLASGLLVVWLNSQKFIFPREGWHYLFGGMISYSLLSGVLLSIFRRQELAADRLGAEIVGSAELMKRALTHVHELARLPARFPNDRRMPHPSLERRLANLDGESAQ